MVQKQTRRRSGLIMGAALALSLGAVSCFFVLAMPIRMLESVTTFTRLSSLMVQAEPPISPNDRTLLAALAGILTVGIGWVLIDWLLFGRAGMRTLIREREDEYEDEDEDSFRPTDPLDLVSPVTLPSGDWVPSPTGDARRPLSARTDIGDPPTPNLAPGVQPLAMPGLDQLLPPIDQILPGVGASPPPLQAGAPSPLFQSTPAPDPFRQTSQPPLPEQPAQPGPSAPNWLPTPGVRADGSQPKFEVPGSSPLEVGPSKPAELDPSAAIIGPAPPAGVVPPLQMDAPESAPAPLISPVAPLETAFAVPSPPASDPPQPPLPPAVAPMRQASDQPFASAQRTMAESGFDKARLEDLLARLERGLEKRRAAAAAARAAQTWPAPVVPPVDAPAPVRPEPPAAYAAHQPAAFEFPPPAAFAASRPIAAPPGLAAPAMPQPLAAEQAPPPDERSGDELLDQPLHVALDLLRNKVKR